MISVRKSIFMASVLVLGLVYVLQHERAELEERGKEQEVTRLYPALKPSTIVELELTSPEGSYRLAPLKSEPVQERVWTVSNNSLTNAAVEDTVVATMLAAAANLRAQNTIGSDELESDRTIYGLDKPSLTIKFKAGNRTETLNFGKKHPFSGRYYAQKQGDSAVLLVDAAGFDTLNKKVDDVRDRHPFKFDPNAVTEIAITPVSAQAGNPVRLLQRGSDGTWTFDDKSQRFEADTEIIERVLADLARLKITGFLDPQALSSLSIRKEASISIRGEGSNEPLTTFDVGEIDEPAPEKPDSESLLVKHKAFYLSVNGAASPFRFDRRVYGEFLKEGLNLRNRSPLKNLKSEDLSRVHFVIQRSEAEPTVEFSLIRESESADKRPWKLQEGPAEKQGAFVEADQRKVSDWIARLVKLRLIAFIDPSDTTHSGLGLSKPKLEIALETKGENFHLIFGNALNEATERPSPQTNPPRYGALTGNNKQAGDSQLLPFLLSHIDWNELNRDSSYFQVVAPSATSDSAAASH